MITTGIIDKNFAEIQSVFSSFPEVEKAVLFGSRAKGNFNSGSDIDISVFGPELNFERMLEISIAMDRLDLMEHVDLVHYERIKEPDLKNHINRVGITIFERNHPNPSNIGKSQPKESTKGV